MIIRTLYALCNHRCRYISLLEFKHEAIPTLLLLCNLYFKIVPRCRFDSMITIWWVPFFLVEVSGATYTTFICDHHYYMISPDCDLSVFKISPGINDKYGFFSFHRSCTGVWYRSLSSRRAIARAASTDLANIHRMPAPEGYCILVFEELGEQEEENTPGIPSGSLIFNPHDVENRTNIGEFFFLADRFPDAW